LRPGVPHALAAVAAVKISELGDRLRQGDAAAGPLLEAEVSAMLAAVDDECRDLAGALEAFAQRLRRMVG
jgi:hypothetical protein